MPQHVKTVRSVLTHVSRIRRPAGNQTFRLQPRQAQLHSTPGLQVVKPYVLADVGEGITECQIVQWFVQPGARVAEFDKVCDVQSDKALVEITSRYSGVIKKLHYEADDIAKVGQPLVDIDVADEDAAELAAQNEAVNQETTSSIQHDEGEISTTLTHPSSDPNYQSNVTKDKETRKPGGSHSNGTLATPAVRHLSKELGIDVSEIEGTGKDGRVLKEDLQNYASTQRESQAIAPSAPSRPIAEDRIIPITGIRAQMFKTMTKSLSIPHFLYTDAVDFTLLNSLKNRFNSQSPSSIPESQKGNKLSQLPFIVKAVSLAFSSFPSLNAHLETNNGSQHILTHKAAHNIGIAIDTPSGLTVPVIQDVQSHTIISLNQEIIRLASLARANRLSPLDLTGATFTISNIGSIGGGAVAPIIVSPQVAILGVGKARVVPAFGPNGEIVRREEAIFSWSADHRVCDGAMVARAGEMVKSYLENIEKMVVGMR